MLTEPNFSTSSSYQPKRIRKFSAEIQDQSNVPRKRQTKTVEDDINPYEAIPELPHVKMTLADMKGDPIQFFMKLEEKYNKFGAVKVSACSQWKCPFQQRFVDRGITTRIQHLSKLKHGKAFEQNVEAYTLHSYQAYALNFEKTYKYKTQPRGKTAQGRKQYEYWSLVTKHEYEKSNVKVQYAADLASLKYGSGFPIHHDPRNQDQHFSYDTNLFNLNNIMNSPTSLLGMSAQRKQKVSGITHPWVYMGSMFSSFCWHVQDLGVNSLNYNHKGGIKTWYVVPGAYKQNFDNYVKSTYCTNNHKQTLLDRITFMIDPLELIKVGIPVYKSHQRPHDFICTFFFAYHCGFSQGYNIGEAVNFLSSNSIEPMKKVAKQKKSHQKSPPNVIPVDWIVYENYKRIKTFANGEKIKEAYSVMINQQKKQLKQAKDLFVVDTLCIFPAQKKYDRVYCNVCKQYLYLRAYQLQEDDKVYCFDHLKKLKPQNKKINLMVRQPSDERRYIYDQFKEAKIEIEIDDTPAQKKQKSKSIPRGM